MRKFNQVFVLIAILITGCSHTITRYNTESELEYYERINKYLSDKDEILIEADKNNQIVAQNIILTKDSVTYINLKTNSIATESTKNISTITVNEKGRGVMEGSVYGLLLGGAIGVAFTEIFLGGGHPGFSPEIIIGFPTAGSLLGAIIGYANESKIKIILK